MKRHSLIHPCRNKIFILSFQYSIMIIFIFTAGEVERPGNGFCFLPDCADDWFVLIWASPITFPSFVAILNHFFLFCSFTEIKETEMLWWIKLRHLYWCLELQRLEKQLCHLFCTLEKNLWLEGALGFLLFPFLLTWFCWLSDISLLTLQQFERKKNHYGVFYLFCFSTIRSQPVFFCYTLLQVWKYFFCGCNFLFFNHSFLTEMWQEGEWFY